MAIWYASQLSAHIGANIAFIIAPKIKAGLTMFLYSKVSRLTSMILQPYSGTLMNLISNDLSALDERMANIFFIFPFIIILIGTSFVIVSKVGWWGIAAMLIVLLIIPISNLISKIGSSSLK